MFNKTFLIVFIINFYFVLGIFQSDDFPNCANSQGEISQKLGLLHLAEGCNDGRALLLEQARGRTLRLGQTLELAELEKNLWESSWYLLFYNWQFAKNIIFYILSISNTQC